MASSHKFVLLDGMRGVAAVVVVLRHMVAVRPVDPLPHAGLAVDLFFVLSGFVIAHAYERRLTEGRMSFAGFLRTRLIRLYPLVALGAAISAMLLLGSLAATHDAGALWRGGAYALGSFAFAPLPTSSLAPASYLGDTTFLNSPEWSLFYELAINLAYAALAVRLTDRRLLAAAGLGALWLVLQPLYLGEVAPGWFTFASAPPRVLFSFTTGVLLFRLHRRHGERAWTASAAILVSALAACLFSPGRYGDFLGVAVTLVALPAIVWMASASRLEGGAARVADWAGRLSYPVYVLHFPLLRMLGPLVDPVVPGAAAMLIELAAILALSALILVGFDQPVRRWLSRPASLGGRAARTELTPAG